ncbi:hypothetical protein PR202_gb19863 [Eleusine coracana subsp. coracana]|uniref:Fungal lipase-type domain-containing protein n=1 Tax=Eleusine coracana subsp. coracana TaxID=191504 RepID=A0AAV5F9W3_ELECO|nr:hypothetical protein PR202_gb19863 [Eleusine coracana subsp. coracana]
MDRPRKWAAVKAAALLLLLSTAPHGATRTEPTIENNEQRFVFNQTLAKAVVEYASAGFEMRRIIVDVQNCLQVHAGFYSSYNNTLLRPAIMNAVHKARKLYRDINIIVTGHSMGGAIASFCALDLAINFGSNDVHLMTFGQPRVGNAAFASYFAKYVPNTIRVTHEHDIVPHLPPYFFFLPRLTYRHFPREVWEHDVDGNTVFQVCDGSGEDPNCCRSVFVMSWSASDHLTYMGVDIAADDWSTCRIVLGRSVESLQMDLASNIVMSNRSVDFVIADHR